MQIGAKRVRTCMQCVHVPTELSLCMPPLVVGLVSWTPCERLKMVFFLVFPHLNRECNLYIFRLIFHIACHRLVVGTTSHFPTSYLIGLGKQTFFPTTYYMNVCPPHAVTA